MWRGCLVAVLATCLLGASIPAQGEWRGADASKGTIRATTVAEGASVRAGWPRRVSPQTAPSAAVAALHIVALAPPATSAATLAQSSPIPEQVARRRRPARAPPPAARA